LAVHLPKLLGETGKIQQIDWKGKEIHSIDNGLRIKRQVE
jgi:hypothetical protein